MPELPHFNPTVSVFHFTSKVSSAKIAKYKLATERGMVVSQTPSNNIPANPRAMGNPSASTSGSSKRPRLKLNVRDPVSNDGDSITVSRPRQATSTGKKRAHSSAFPGNDKPTRQRPAASDASSDLSSLDSEILAEQPAPQAKSKGREGYGDLMSYYVLDDDDEEEAKASKAASKPKKQRAPVEPPSVQTRPVPPPPPLPRYPQPPAIAPVAIDIRMRDPDPIPIMIMKLEALSAALTDFGGVPPIPLSPDVAEEPKNPLDNFLAMFGEIQPANKKPGDVVSLDDLEHQGLADKPLVHGIQFIMNALKSWAEQRLAAQRMHQMQQNLAAQRRASGKVKLSPNDSDPPAFPIPPVDMRPVSLFETPEGRAISAFRAVVESGCLRVNAVVPMKLAKALRHLYMQIDHLINQSSKVQHQWRCLSYVAQIDANKTRVEKWKESQAKAQEEMIRQHQLSHQQMMRQMGLPDHFTSTMFYHHNTDVDATEATRYSAQDLVRLPANPRPDPPIKQVSYGSVPQSAPQHQIMPSRPNGAFPVLPAAFLPRSGQNLVFSFTPEANHATNNHNITDIETARPPVIQDEGSNTVLSMTPDHDRPQANNQAHEIANSSTPGFAAARVSRLRTASSTSSPRSTPDLEKLPVTKSRSRAKPTNGARKVRSSINTKNAMSANRATVDDDDDDDDTAIVVSSGFSAINRQKPV